METSKKINLIYGRQIAIVGGGPGGLALARLLQLGGADVKVYERDINQKARVQGAIVDLHYHSGLKVLEAAGLMDAFKIRYMQGADSFRVVDERANILLDDFIPSGRYTFGDEHFRPEIDRGALRDILIDSLLPGTVVWDSQLINLTFSNGQWEMQFKNGTSASSDLVIGCEGYRSRIREYLTDIKSVYTGAAIIQGEIDDPKTACPEIYEIFNGGSLMAMGQEKMLTVQPRGDGGLTFYAASMYPENWEKTSGINFNNPEEVYAYLIHFYNGWHPAFHKLFKACSHFTYRPLNYHPLKLRWQTRSNIIILGDAAHLMPPNGEGVNLAMMDALDLSNCLTSGAYQNIEAALAAYEEMMFARTYPISEETVEGIKDFASPNNESIQKLIQLFGGDEKI
ncbi:2-polyprenyl-6-methoxyphenol hydroxylase [Pedobacter terrae]|uniref:Flavin-dependent monooxygenase n=1 Tax=Pedobacter terrae TaxID=405671 RepID=A0A1G7MVK0_9SPHI|nr:NAD(P)/FAD-dependent oxidoreductase [Pedobacter terrae]SDF65696.1 2-polyprenyl-6-methoxyphenol hydroxylase [Pedobacter terrae]